MAKLNAANLAQSLLDGAITDTADTMTVLDGSIFPDTPFAVTVEDEIIYVIVKTGNTFSSVLRAQEGTTAAAHTTGVSVENRMTAGMYNALATQEEINEHSADEATLNQLGHIYHTTLTTTLDTDWDGTEAPYSKTQTVTGIIASDTPIIDVVMSGNFETDKKQANEWSKIYRITTSDNSITLYATDKPTVSLPIQLKVVR